MAPHVLLSVDGGSKPCVLESLGFFFAPGDVDMTHSIPRIFASFVILASALALGGCSIKSMAVGAMADSFEESAKVYAEDDDPQLVADAFPFLLKTIESLLAQQPKNEKLLIQAAQGFTSYGQAFVAVPASQLEYADLEEARRQRERAFKLFVRAREYGLRALRLRHPEIETVLREDPETALAATRERDVPALFWTGAAWALSVSTNKSDMEVVADFEAASALLRRVNELAPDWEEGSVDEVLIVLEAATAGGGGGSVEGARAHFERAMDLTRGRRIGALVSLAESVAIREQNLPEFEQLLGQVLAFDVESAPEYRLVNLLAQRRARWLLDHRAYLFIDYEEEAGS